MGPYKALSELLTASKESSLPPNGLEFRLELYANLRATVRMTNKTDQDLAISTYVNLIRTAESLHAR